MEGAKPKLRGVLHQWAAVWALGAGAALAAMAPTGRTALAAGLYALSLVALFTVSATYHRVQWSAEARARMRRADHASIFVLIAGTYTPVALIGLPASAGNSACSREASASSSCCGSASTGESSAGAASGSSLPIGEDPDSMADARVRYWSDMCR